MAMISDHWSELVEPRLRQAFFIGFGQEDRRASMIPELDNVQGSSRADEKLFPLGGQATNAWNFEDSGRVQYEEIVKGRSEEHTS